MIEIFPLKRTSDKYINKTNLKYLTRSGYLLFGKAFCLMRKYPFLQNSSSCVDL